MFAAARDPDAPQGTAADASLRAELAARVAGLLAERVSLMRTRHRLLRERRALLETRSRLLADIARGRAPTRGREGGRSE